ncbi:MAG: sigma 54-interacting transcriptional regulator [Vicinamibacterales bacterium]
MDLTYQDANRLFQSGEFAGLIEAFRERNAQTTDPETRILLANAYALTGHFEKAKAAASVDEKRLSARANSQRETALGLVKWREGNSASAVGHFQSSIRIAQESRDPERLAWAHLHLFRFLIEDHPLDELMARLSDVRRSVISAGSPQVTAYLHACVSVLEGQTGRLAEASRHCDIAEALLEKAPNAWVSGILSLNRACLAVLDCRFEQASSCVAMVLQFVEQSGHVRTRQAAEVTLGHVELILGKFEKAQRTLRRVLADPSASQFFRIAAADGLARLHLALDQADQGEQVLDAVDFQTHATREIASTYHTRWAAITKARLLQRQGRANEAVAWLKSVEDNAAAFRDLHFSAALHIESARCLTDVGLVDLAAWRLLRAEELGITNIRELQGQYYFAAGLNLRQRSPTLAVQLRDRGSRVWHEQGVVSARLEMDSSGTGHSGATPETRRKPAPVPQTLDCLADAIAAVFDVAYHPRLLASELLAIIRALECSPDTQVVETRTTEPEATPGRVTLPLGTIDHKKLTLVCAVPSEPAQAVLLGNVLRIGRSALALEKAHQDERSRSALWPASPVEEQAGALFLAEEMQTLLSTARRIATTNVPVLITGETGTGKEILARTIHGYSLRATKTFLPFNCTATPREMLDAQLFGHRRGAFTGATEHFPGIIRAAAGGTLFLDEIGEATLDAQPKLLRFLDSGEVHPIGDTHPAHVDVRIIAATNADLDSLVTQGRFREDLFYRLNIVRLHVPPLRERRSEVPALANHYLLKYGIEAGRSNLRLSEETMEYLVLYRWPGNVRQLANEMRRIAVLAENGAVLMPEHLSPSISASRRTIPASERHLDLTEVVVRLDQPMPAAVQHLERAMIQYALQKSGGRMEETAARLGVSRKGLYLKRQRFGLETPSGDVGLP